MIGPVGEVESLISLPGSKIEYICIMKLFDNAFFNKPDDYAIADKIVVLMRWVPRPFLKILCNSDCNFQINHSEENKC